MSVPSPLTSMVVNFWKYYEFTHNYVGNLKVASLSADKEALLKDEVLEDGC